MNRGKEPARSIAPEPIVHWLIRSSAAIRGEGLHPRLIARLDRVLVERVARELLCPDGNGDFVLGILLAQVEDTSHPGAREHRCSHLKHQSQYHSEANEGRCGPPHPYHHAYCAP
jgi:hypothetical protein